MNPKSGTVIYIEYRKEGESSLQVYYKAWELHMVSWPIRTLICILKTKLSKFDTLVIIKFLPVYNYKVFII